MDEMMLLFRKNPLPDGIVFLEEVSESNFSTYQAASVACGFSQGSIPGTVARRTWLKYAYNKKIAWVPKVPIRTNVSYAAMYLAGLVYGEEGFGRTPVGTPTDQLKIITIGGVQYLVRLIKGALEDPPAVISGYDNELAYGCEWNRLFYPITTDARIGDPVGAPKTASFSPADFWPTATTNTYSYCLESTNANLSRGYDSITRFNSHSKSGVNASAGWRPILLQI